MSASVLASARPGPAPAGTGAAWLLLPLGILVLSQVLLGWTGTVAGFDGSLADPDGYMRLNRVLHLHEAGGWFEPSYPRINPPDGHLQHWTRPLDALLLAGAWLLQPALGFERALHVWGVALSPVCLGLALLALNWASTPVLGRDARLVACLALLLQPSVVAYGSLGRPDHHALLLLLFVLLLGAGIRLLTEDDPRMPRLAGGLAALALWVSSESLVFIAAAHAGLGIAWLVGEPRAGARTRAFAAWATLWLVLALLLERGPGGFASVDADRLSLVHLVLFAQIALFWATMAPFPERMAAGPGARVAVAAAGVMLLAACMALLFPDLRHGPLGTVDPLYAELRLRRIVEIQPLIQPAWLADGRHALALGRVLELLGIGVVALPFLGVVIARSSGGARQFWLAVALGLAAYLPLSFYQVRWTGYAETLLVLPYAAAVISVLRRVSAAIATRWLAIARPLVITAALFWPFPAAYALPQARVETATQACPVRAVATALEAAGAGEAKVVLTLADYGPEILYRTRHSVLSIPNHRPQPGFALTHAALAASRPAAARALLAARGVDWILLCPGGTERAFFTRGAEGRTLYERLVAGEVPGWLRPVPLPEALGDHALLFALVPDAPRPGAARTW